MSILKSKIFSLILISTASILVGTTAAQTRIAVLYSGYTEMFSDNRSPKVIDEITLWELFLMQEKIPYEVIYDRDLESDITDDFDILILPSVSAISSEESESIKDFLYDGKSILIVGSKLSMDDNRIYFGFDNLKQLFGIQSAEYPGKDFSFPHHLNFNPMFNNDPKFDGLLQISTKYLPLICDIQTLKNPSLGYFKIKGYNEYQTSMIYGLQGNGKFVWIGFNMDDVVGGKSDTEKFKHLIINSINWLDKKPDVWISNFPTGKNSSTIITVENNYGLNPELIDKLNQDDIEPYLIISPAQKIAEKVKTRFKEENLILDLSNLFTNEDGSVQNFVDELIKFDKVLGVTFKTVIIPESLIKDNVTLNSMSDAGVDVFLFSSNYAGLPSVINNKFFIIPFCAENQDNYDLGAVSFLTYKSRTTCDGNPEEDFLKKVFEAKSSNSWIVTLDSLKDWWMRKNNISASIEYDQTNRASLIVANNNLQEVRNINLILGWPYMINLNQLSVNYRNEIFDYSIDKSNMINLSVEKISARETKRINLIFNRE